MRHRSSRRFEERSQSRGLTRTDVIHFQCYKDVGAIMRFRVDISLEIEADDYIAAAEHQRRVGDLFALMKENYPDAEFSFRQLRNLVGAAQADGSSSRSSSPRSTSRGRGHFRHVTGNLSVYQER